MAQPSTRATSSHLKELDGFRAFSILAVLSAHMLPLGPKSLQLNATAGFMGMSVFFALSGFLITSFLWKRPDIRVFLVRRFARIVPLVLLSSFLIAGIIHGRWDSFIVTNIYLLNYFDAANFGAIGPLWSVSMEMQFYLSIALAIAVFGRAGFVVVPIAAIIITALRAHYDV